MSKCVCTGKSPTTTNHEQYIKGLHQEAVNALIGLGSPRTLVAEEKLEGFSVKQQLVGQALRVMGFL